MSSEQIRALLGIVVINVLVFQFAGSLCVLAGDQDWTMFWIGGSCAVAVLWIGVLALVVYTVLGGEFG